MEKNSTTSNENSEMIISGIHYVNNSEMKPPFKTGLESIIFGMGCFWGAEKCFWPLEGVYTTAVGYIAGQLAHPTYQQVCSGQTGHNEAVLLVYDPNIVNLKDLLILFWQSHDPTQGMRQGNDKGTQYRSGIYTTTKEQLELANLTKNEYQKALTKAGYPEITTEIKTANNFYYAEEYHQQYLAKNINGYCGLGGTSVFFGGD